MSEQRPVNILCLKWGTRYPAAYTNILYASVKRHLHRPFRFVCLTDDPTGLNPGIDPRPIPECPDIKTLWGFWPNIFVKLCLYKPGLADLAGPTLFFDVDVVIQQDLDCFFDYEPGRFCIIHNWVERRKRLFRRLPDIGNSSLFRFDAASPQAAAVYDCFLREMKDAVNHALYPTEQAFMTHAMTLAAGGELPRWWPDQWVKSFKRTCVPVFPLNLLVTPRKPDAKVLVFHGHPDPDTAVKGFRAKHIHNSVRPCPWILEDWRE